MSPEQRSVVIEALCARWYDRGHDAVAFFCEGVGAMARGQFRQCNYFMRWSDDAASASLDAYDVYRALGGAVMKPGRYERRRILREYSESLDSTCASVGDLVFCADRILQADAQGGRRTRADVRRVAEAAAELLALLERECRRLDAAEPDR